MKKNIFLWVAVFAVGAMSSCSVDKVVDQAEARYIGFDPFANKVTRTLNATDFGHSDFDVWGKYEDVEVFAGKTVSWQTSSWTYQPLVPWVAGKTYEFAAIAPHVKNASYDYENDQYSLGEITVNATPATQIDYMTADVKTVSSGANPVSFDFNHILSKIDFNFKPKTAVPNAWLSPVKIDIKKITLAQVNTVNAYNANNWGTSKTPVDFVKGDASVIGSTTYDGTSNVTALEGQFSWLVVPQTETDASSRALTIKFDVSTKDATGAYNVKVLTDKEATVEIANNWVANTVYIYTVYIGSDILGPNAYITFDVASANWSTPNQESNLNVPTTTAP